MLIAQINKSCMITDKDDLFHVGNPNYKRIQEYLLSLGFQAECNHTFHKDGKTIKFRATYRNGYVFPQSIKTHPEQNMFQSLLYYCTDDDPMYKNSTWRRVERDIARFLDS